jgi:signal transduction histidine kinase
MGWRALRSIAARHHELALAAGFGAMAAWELVEIVALELRHGAVGPLTLAVHSAQVALVVGVTLVVIRAWRARARHEEALERMVETVVMAQEEERRRIAYDVHDGIAQLIVSAKQHVETGPRPRRPRRRPRGPGAGHGGGSAAGRHRGDAPRARGAPPVRRRIRIRT